MLAPWHALLALLAALPLFAGLSTELSARAPTFAQFAATARQLQDELIATAREADPAAVWSDDAHPRGRAVILEGGRVWEKGCISATIIEDAELSAVRASTISARTGASIRAGARYSACALSFVLHASSPLVPTLRGDVRLFRVEGGEFFGGGIDLTPSYVNEADCSHFHKTLAALCASLCEPSTYAAMKAACDEYFFLPCRGEHRGVGGVFFDDLTEPWAAQFCEALMRCALASDGPYMPIVHRNAKRPFTEAQKTWQLLRRGRYVEFNLLYDRGVRFGLTPESVERVLVSSPPVVEFKYKAVPKPGSPEAETLEVLRCPREW